MNPLLTISIPTYNRYEYLKKNLEILLNEKSRFDDGTVEIIVLDNSECGETPDFIRILSDSSLIKYIKHGANIGSDANIAMAYDIAVGTYVLVLGDDDFFLPGKLYDLIEVLRETRYDVFFLRASGFDVDYIKEVPLLRSGVNNYASPVKFLGSIGAGVTFISSLVIKREFITNAEKFVGTNLIQCGVLFSALLFSSCMSRSNEYYISAKRNNSGGYNKETVFVENLHNIVSAVFLEDLRRPIQKALNKSMLFKFFPQRYMIERTKHPISPEVERCLKKYFGREMRFWLFLYPVLRFPYPIAIIYGLVITAIARSLDGDLRRILKFLRVKAKLI